MFKAIRRWRRGGKMQKAVHQYPTREAAIAYARRYVGEGGSGGFCDVLDEDGNRVYRLTADGTENFALVPAED